MLITFIH